MGHRKFKVADEKSSNKLFDEAYRYRTSILARGRGTRCMIAWHGFLQAPGLAPLQGQRVEHLRPAELSGPRPSVRTPSTDPHLCCCVVDIKPAAAAPHAAAPADL